MEKYILTIDQGTTSTRIIIFNKKQEVVLSVQKEIKVYYPKTSWIEQDPIEIWQSVVYLFEKIFSDGKILPQQIGAIGITNQRETTVIWNKKTGIPVYNAIVWQSRQTSDIVDYYKMKEVDDIIKKKTGLILDPYFSATKIKWILNNIDKSIDSDDLLFGTIDTWILWNLTSGKVHASDVTNASRTLLFNINTLDWDDELLKCFEIDRQLLPSVKDTSGIFGYTSKNVFYNCECPISAMVGDQQSALFGESCFNRNDIKNTYGTGGFLLANVGEKPIFSQNGLLSTVAWKIKDEVKYALEGSIFVSGSLIQWLRDELKFFDDACKSEDIANSVNDSNGVIIVPSFAGLGAPYWNKECKGAIFGLTRGTTIAHITRAALESMAFQTKDLIEVMQVELKDYIKTLKVDGGAAANNYLLQFQADILGIPIIKCKNIETTALGACRLAGLAVNYFTMNDFEDDKNIIFNPRMSKMDADLLFNKYKTAVNSMLNFK